MKVCLDCKTVFEIDEYHKGHCVTSYNAWNSSFDYYDVPMVKIPRWHKWVQVAMCALAIVGLLALIVL